MKEIKLTQGKTALVDDADYDFVNQWKWCAHRNQQRWYAERGEYSTGKCVMIKMHRLLMNTPIGIVVDHIDGNGLNCQRSNMRNCTNKQNLANRASSKNSSSKYLGVFYHSHRKRWAAALRKDKKKIYLGYFINENDAALAYNKAAIIHHGEFANLNKIFCNPCIINSNNLIQKFN